MEKLLVADGKRRGRSFVTEAEILHAFPNYEDDITGLEHVMDALNKRGIGGGPGKWLACGAKQAGGRRGRKTRQRRQSQKEKQGRYGGCF